MAGGIQVDNQPACPLQRCTDATFILGLTDCITETLPNDSFGPEAAMQTLDYQTPQPKRPLLRFLPVGFCILGFLFLLNMILIPSRSGPRDVSNRVKSQSNLRQIGQAILMYSNENAGAYPPNFAMLLLTEDITSEVFSSPASNDTKAGGTDHAGDCRQPREWRALHVRVPGSRMECESGVGRRRGGVRAANGSHPRVQRAVRRRACRVLRTDVVKKVAGDTYDAPPGEHAAGGADTG